MVKPTDVRGLINLYNADSLEVIKEAPNNHWDLLIADPPYGIGMSKPAGLSQKYSKKKLTDKEWDNNAPSKEFFRELFRVSKHQVIFGANHFIDQLPEPRNTPSWIVWDKRENFIPERTYADGELAWTSFKSPTRIFRFYWDGFLQRQKEIRIHPTQKPVSLYEWILIKYAERGDKILDPFGGAFGIAIACDKLAFQLDVVELDQEYYKISLQRLDDHLSAPTLF